MNHCYDLRFARPMKVTIAKRVKAVAKMEGMDVDDNAAEMLVEANGNDIRQARDRGGEQEEASNECGGEGVVYHVMHHRWCEKGGGGGVLISCIAVVTSRAPSAKLRELFDE